MPASNDSHPELHEIAHHVGPALVKALRKGNRGLALLKDLHDDSKAVLVLRGGQTRRTKSALEAGTPRFLEFFRTNDKAVSDAVVLWFGGVEPGDPLERQLSNWRDALRFRLFTALETGELLEPIREEIDSVIAGDVDALPASTATACLNWFAGARASRLAAEMELILANFGLSFAEIRSRITEIAEATDLESWMIAARAGEALTDLIGNTRASLEAALRSAAQLAPRLGLEPPCDLGELAAPPFTVADPAGIEGFVAHLGRVGSEKAAEAVRAIASSIPLQALVALPSRLTRELPERDRDVLNDEAERLTALTDGTPTPAELARAAPVLSILERILLRGEVLTKSDLELLEERLTGKTCRRLREGQLPLEGEGASDDPSRRSWEDDSILSVDAETERPAEEVEAADEESEAEPVQTKGVSEPGDGREHVAKPTTDAASDLTSDAVEPSNVDPVEETARIEREASESSDSTGPARPIEPESPSAEEAAGRLARLLDEGDLDLAYWYAYSLGDRSPLPLWLVEIVELGIQLRPSFLESERRLQDLLAVSLTQIAELEPYESFLLAAACVRPALVSPVSSMLAVDELAETAPAVPGLQQALRDLAEFAKKGRPLGGSLLRGLASSAHLEEERGALARRTEDWRLKAPTRSTKFQAATAVWKHWVQQDGELRRLVESAKSGVLRHKTALEQIEGWRDRQSFTEKVDRTDRRLRKKAKPIRHGAFDALHRWVIESIELAEDWLEVRQAEDDAEKNERRHELTVLRSLKPSSEVALKALRELDQKNPLEASCKLLLERSLEELVSDFEELARPAAARDPLLERKRLLLRLPGVGRELEKPPRDLLQEQLVGHLGAPLTAEEAIEQHLSKGQLDLAEALLGFVPGEAISDRSIERFAEAEREWKKRVENRILEVDEVIEREHLKGVLGQTEKDYFVTELGVVKSRAATEPGSPDELMRACDEIDDKLRSIESKKVAALEVTFSETEHFAQEQGVEVPDEVRRHFDGLLSRGSVAVANEVIAAVRHAIESGRIEVGRIVDTPTDRDHFADLLAVLPSLYREAGDIGRLRARLREGKLIEILGRSDRQQVKIADAALEKWQLLVQGRHLDVGDLGAHLSDVLRWLGFQIEGLPKRVGYGPNWKHLRVTAKVDAPIPKYGSLANGKHDVILIWGELEPEELGQLLATNSKLGRDRAATVLHFNRVDRDARRRSMNSVRNQRHAALLLDNCMMIWLTMFGAAARTKAMFEAGLPGSRGNPYAPEAAGAVPPEMFFGRESHVEDLWRPTGPAIVYGGRQLGKSALLQRVRRKYDDPEHDQFVFYSGLRHHTDVFDLIRELLSRNELLPKRGLKGSEEIQPAIEDMLRENPARRILVLLDECDQFLDEDRGRNFEQVSRVRDLMTNTERRLKVVFAGLHNVQRFQRVPNQPLAHFGEPLCVGPLGSPAARNLVRVPLRTLGYRFKPESLVDRILAYTNSHPSLIQLFCHALLEALEQRKFSHIENTPPYTIDEDLIAQIYRSTALGRKMRDRFDWTLDLDPRYRVLGYVIAFLEQESHFDESGAIPAYEALSWARDFWPAAFREANEDEVVGLLDEMKGLGVLVSRGPRGYRLRSPNVVRLLGGPKEVMNQLDAFRVREYQPELVPQVIRRAFEDPELPASPLTLDQMGALTTRDCGIDLIVGSEALTLRMVLPALRLSLEGREGISIHQIEENDPAELTAAIRNVYQNATNSQGILLWLGLAPTIAELLPEVAQKVAGWLKTLRADHRFVRLLVPVDASALRHLHDTGRKESLFQLGLVRIHHLRRWKEVGVRQWLYDVDRAGPMDLPGRWVAETGGWPLLMLPRLRSALLGDAHTEPEGTSTQLLEAAGLPANSDEERLFRTLINIASKEAETDDLVDIVQEEGGPPRERTRALIRYMLDLEMLIGTPDKVRVEPVLAEAARATAAKG